MSGMTDRREAAGWYPGYLVLSLLRAWNGVQAGQFSPSKVTVLPMGLQPLSSQR